MTIFLLVIFYIFFITLHQLLLVQVVIFWQFQFVLCQIFKHFKFLYFCLLLLFKLINRWLIKIVFCIKECPEWEYQTKRSKQKASKRSSNIPVLDMTMQTKKDTQNECPLHRLESELISENILRIQIRIFCYFRVLLESLKFSQCFLCTWHENLVKFIK